MICEKNKCVGCFACYNTCPKNAIEMITDDNGFIYPKINKDKCINCNLCKKVCPAINDLEYKLPQKCYAAQRKDKIKLKESSSGGAASVFAEEILSKNGIVYACAFEENFKIHHIRIDKKSDLKKMKGSKYVHSYIEDTYKKAKNDLNDKKQILFIGTPCQIAGLKLFLKKDYDNLLCVDLICHGVPSQLYLKEELESEINTNKISELKFRIDNDFKILAKDNKKILMDKSMDKSRYYEGFMDSFFYRENCYECKYARIERISDITIGDFWGLKENSTLYNIKDKGVSIILTQTEKGEKFILQCKNKFNIEERYLEEGVEGNSQLRHAAIKDKNYSKFKKLYPKKGFSKAYDTTRPVLTMKKKLKKIKIIKNIYYKLKRKEMAK